MSLEAAILAHAAALEKLAAALNRESTAITTTAATPKAPKKEAPAAPATTAAPAATAPAAAAAPAAPSTEELRAEGKTLILKVMAKKGKPAGIALLDGAANVSAVPVEKLPAFIAACKKELA